MPQLILPGIPVYVFGSFNDRVAPTKMAAKILSDLSKPDGLRMVEAEGLVDFLSPLPVERLWGVGRVTLLRMNQAGIATVGGTVRRMTRGGGGTAPDVARPRDTRADAQASGREGKMDGSRLTERKRRASSENRGAEAQTRPFTHEVTPASIVTR